MIKLNINCATKSAGSQFADTIADLLRKYTVYPIYSKTTVQGKDVYKITWYYSDNINFRRFGAWLEDSEHMEDGSFEQDVHGNPIIQQELLKQREKIKPDEIMRKLEESGNLKVYCAMHGMKQVKPLKFTSKSEEASGGGRLHETGFRIHFITGYFEQHVSEYQIADLDWKIKCLTALLSDGKVFKDNKKVKLPNTDGEFSWDNAKTVHRKKNIFTVSGYQPSLTKSKQLKPLKDPEGYIQEVKAQLQEYYPEFADSYTFSNDNGIVTITVA